MGMLRSQMQGDREAETVAPSAPPADSVNEPRRAPRMVSESSSTESDVEVVSGATAVAQAETGVRKEVTEIIEQNISCAVCLALPENIGIMTCCQKFVCGTCYRRATRNNWRCPHCQNDSDFEFQRLRGLYDSIITIKSQLQELVDRS